MNRAQSTQKTQSRLENIVWWSSWIVLWPAIHLFASRLCRKRVPVVLQMSQTECGAACLAMILGYYGHPTRVSECKEVCDVGRDGLNARKIAEAARRYGLRVKAYSAELSQFGHLQLPAIVHWNFNHFVVVERWTPRYVDIVDPAGGRCRLTAHEFGEGFTGVALSFEPSIHFKRHSNVSTSPWRDYLRYMLLTPGVRLVLLQVLVASLFLQLIGLAPPIFTKVIVDNILPYRIDSVMNVVGIGMIILILSLAVMSYLRAALLIYLQARLDTRLMLGFFEHMLTLPFAYFQRRSSGDLLMRLGSNVILRELLTNQTISTVLDVGMVVTYLAILLVIAPAYGAIVVAIGTLQIIILLVTVRKVHGLMQRGLEAQAKSQSYQVEALAGIAALKASGGESRALEHWTDLFYKHLNISLQRDQLNAAISTAMSSLRTLSPLLLLWVGAIYVLNGEMSLGTMLALNTLALSFLTPLSSLVSTGQQLQLVGAHLERIADVIEAEPEQVLGAVQSAPKLTGRIEVKNVSFQYDSNAPMTLSNISFSIEPGQKIALVGRTGSGKSTLAMLLLGLYKPTRGEVLYDGLPLESLDYRSLRSQFGVVLQEPSLFSGSIRENIAFNNPALSLEQVVEAAHLAAIHEEILQMPMGYETLISEGGSAVSGGQRQRLALARALAHRPAALLLDEATSHLDASTERTVDRNLNSLECTRIVIAHRLSTVQNADLIIVLDEGKIVERGTYDEILEQDGLYASLVRHQKGRDEPQEASLSASIEDALHIGFADLTAAGRDRNELKGGKSNVGI